MTYLLHLSIYLSIYMIAALSLNLIVGYLGRLTLAHAGFVAIGAYVYAILGVKFGVGFFPALLLAVAVAVFGSLTLSIPAMRFRGDPFIIVTLAVQTLLFAVASNWFRAGAEVGSWVNMTNGPFGIALIPKPRIAGVSLDAVPAIAGLSAIVTIAFAVAVFRLTRSPWGRLLRCIRDDELAARSLGKRVRLIKLQAFALACAMAAVGGTLYAAYISYVDPSLASLNQSILFLSMVIVGGVGNFVGPIVGALVLLLLPEVLRLASLPENLTGNVQMLVYGVLLVAMMHFRPQGLAGAYRLE